MQQEDTRDNNTADDEPATKRKIGACLRWGITAMGLGAVLYAGLFTLVVFGHDINPEVARAWITCAIGGLLGGLMAILADRIMQHVDDASAARATEAEQSEETQTAIAQELVQIHAGITTLLSAGGRSDADWDAKIEKLRDELSGQIGKALVEGLRAEGTVVSFRNRKPL